MFHLIFSHWKRHYLFLLFAIVLLSGCQTPTSAVQPTSQTPTSTPNLAFAPYVGTWDSGAIHPIPYVPTHLIHRPQHQRQHITGAMAIQ
jgi:uncharacterized protein YceK